MFPRDEKKASVFFFAGENNLLISNKMFYKYFYIKRVGIARKTLDDYHLCIRRAKEYGFDL